MACNAPNAYRAFIEIEVVSSPTPGLVLVFGMAEEFELPSGAFGPAGRNARLGGVIHDAVEGCAALACFTSKSSVDLRSWLMLAK
jgi:hypothetical protein